MLAPQITCPSTSSESLNDSSSSPTMAIVEALTRRMNPQRISSLLTSPSPSNGVLPKYADVPAEPLETGANREALGAAPSAASSTAPSAAPAHNSNTQDEPPRYSDSIEEAEPHVNKETRVVLPPFAALVGILRSPRPLQDQYEEAQRTHIHHLESLVEYNRFQLTLYHPHAKTGPRSYSLYVSHAGLLLNQMVRTETMVPVLPLPSLIRLNGKNAVVGKWDQFMHGHLLEDVWSTLAPTSKQEIARQLKKMLNILRSIPTEHDQRTLGSVSSGPYSLMIDKHKQSTCWVIRPRPSHELFVNFLQSTFDESVPPSVAEALARQLETKRALVFSHGELCPRNIVVHDDKLVAILSWNCAGWYPDWWDYVKFFESPTRPENRDWYSYAPSIFRIPYPKQLAAYQGFARWQKP